MYYMDQNGTSEHSGSTREEKGERGVCVCLCVSVYRCNAMTQFTQILTPPQNYSSSCVWIIIIANLY